MVKLKVALIFSVIAALVVAIAGLLTEVRFIVIGLRCIVGFLVAGLVAYLVAFILEAKSIMQFELAEEGPGASSGSEESAEKPEKEQEGTKGESGEKSEDDVEEPEEGAEGEFQPLDAESLRHVETSGS